METALAPWHKGTRALNEKQKPWSNRELRENAEALPPMTLEESQRAARGYESTTGVGSDCFHTKFPLDLTEKRCSGIRNILTKVEQCGCWPQQAVTTMFSFFTIPKASRANGQRCFPPSWVGRNGWRAPLVQGWKSRGTLVWDATACHHGGAERTAQDGVLDMERGDVKASDEFAVTFVVHLATFLSGFSWCSCGSGRVILFPEENYQDLVRVLGTPEKGPV